MNTNRVSWQYNLPQFIEIIERAVATAPMGSQSHTCYQNYEKLIKSGSNSLDILVDVALEHWRKKL
ncbi:MAG: hypothetical protein VKL59_07780 [Nostocaceae cyanobacterium]|nr:hypothetical protein [Nostocaceae cyanobacterium]